MKPKELMPYGEQSSPLQLLESLRKRGFNENFVFENNTLLTADRTRSFHPSDLRILESHRFEGPSSPDDMSVVYVIESRDGEVRGAVVDSFGVYGDATLEQFVHGISDERQAEH